MQPPQHMLPTRLSKFVASSAMISHREVKRAWHAGRISVWDEVRGVEYCPDIRDYIFPDDDSVRLDGVLLKPRAASSYYVLHKPEGVITTARDPQQRACLDRWLDELPDGVFPVGRLDRATTGALFLTDDGDLANMMLHPEFHVHKLYALTISTRRDPVAEGLRLLEQGVDIDDGKGVARAIKFAHMGTHEGGITVHLTLAEGRNRQIRKMCKAAHLYLDHLHRVSFGLLTVHDLTPGECRALSDTEVESMWSACGGREVPWRRTIAKLALNATHYRSQNDPHERLESWLHAYQHDIAPQYNGLVAGQPES